MKSNQFVSDTTAKAEDVNNLREDARASSYLLSHQQETPDLTLQVEAGNVYFGSELTEFAGGNSPSFTDPSSDPRIDVLSLDDTGTLIRTGGTEAASPSAPDIPAGNIPIAQIYNRAGQTQINDSDQADGNGYIQKDLRSFIRNQSIDVQTFNTNGTWTKPTGAKSVLVTLFGAGGGGGGGEGDDNGNSEPGSGGGGGAMREEFFQADDLDGTVAITIGTGGVGGDSIENDNGEGGGNGGDTTFGTFLTGYGGGGGEGGRSSNDGKGGSGGSTAPGLDLFDGRNKIYEGAGAAHGHNGGNSIFGGGGGGSVRSSYFDEHDGGSSLKGGGGGGSGGNFYQDDGGDGGRPGVYQAGGGGAGGGDVNIDGSNGDDFEGGGGGGVEANGGNGGICGGGGGGGGGDDNSINGDGGDGGDGFARITTFF